MQKRSIIRKIKEIILNYGTFDIFEAEGADGVCVNEMGHIVALAEYFNHNCVEVKIYDPTSFTSDPIGDYEMKYEELSKEVLQAILDVALIYEADQEKTIKRCAN